MEATSILQKIIELDMEIAELQEQFDSTPDPTRHSVLTERLQELLSSLGPDDELPRLMFRIVEMIGVLDNSAALLAIGLSHANEEVQHLCGEALVDIASESGVEAILPAITHATDRQDLSATVMPIILGAIDDPAVLPHIHRFLEMEDPQIVFRAIEACANVSDMDSLPPLRRLVEDTREIDIDEDEGPVTIGMLAKEALELIEAVED